VKVKMKTLESTLITKNVKPTAMRLLVLEYLTEQQVAVSLTDIENHFERSDRTTLYRSLQTFVTHDIVHKIDDGTGVSKYALCEENCHCVIESDLHVHFHCNACNETICLPQSKIPHINLPDAFVAEEITLVVRGICEKCSK
jgi:Fur family ferric uptake transcriptional regulator